jgi:hypothetical protein
MEEKNMECGYERGSNILAGVIFLGVGLLFFVLNFILIPVLGIILALPAAGLGIAFLAAPRSQACRRIAERTRGVFSKSR